jgi:hypothetical protein
MADNSKELKLIEAAAYFFMPTGAYIAGGALTSAFTGQPIRDVDMYFKSEESFRLAVEQAYEEGLWCVSNTDRAVTFVKDCHVIQLMHFDWFENAAAIFDAFDFTCCMAALDCETGEFTFHDDFLKHASQRFLKFHSGTRFPYGTLTRVLKYQARGYTIGKGELLRIALKCASVEIGSWDELEKQIGGQYGEKVNLNATGDFSFEAAIKAMDGVEIITPTKNGDMPSSAFELLQKIFNERDS